MKVNWSSVKENPVVPRGIYNLAVTKYKFGEGNVSGAPTVTITFTVVDGEHEGTLLFNKFSLQPQALFSLKRLLQLVNVPSELLSGEHDLEEALESALTNKVSAVVGLNNEGTQNIIKSYRAYGLY